MKLFKFEGYKVIIEPEALLLKPFRLIWERDKKETKEKAINELGFVYFFANELSYNFDAVDFISVNTRREKHDRPF